MRFHATHPPLTATAQITLPAGVIECPCGLHYMVRGHRIRPQHCRWLASR